MRNLQLQAGLAVLVAALSLASAQAADSPPRHPKTPPAPKDFYTHSGFDGRIPELATAVMDAIRKAKPANGEALGFTPAQQEAMGLAVARAIQVTSVTDPYQHELNDAVVKAQLTALQFAKNNNLMEQYVDHETKTQAPMLQRVGKLINMGGSPELGMIAITERTACFYQLVLDYKRDGMTIRWKSPYRTVLQAGTRLGQFDMTEQEVHEKFTVPTMKKRAAVMGMDVTFTPWQEDGWITMTASMAPKTAAN